MTGASRTATAVTFLAEDDEARRLVVSWPLVPTELRDAAMLHAWSAASGVPLSRVQRLAQVLLRHELCRADGTVDPEALRVIQHVAAELLRSTPKKGRSR